MKIELCLAAKRYFAFKARGEEIVAAKVMRVESDTFCDPFIQKSNFCKLFYEAAELCKASDDGGLLILLEILNDKRSLFTTSKTDRHLLRKKVRQRISAMKTNTGVFVVFKTKRELKCQFSGNIECVCFHY